jgi:endonuclease/exonuclease/phosphatase family metal-dependent hydrolase
MSGTLSEGRVFLFCSLVFLLASCGGCSVPLGPGADRQGYTFLAYNVNNLFDDADDGTEYPEYDPSEGVWTTEKYREKLGRLGRVLTEAVPGGADFLALTEIENLRVLEDLSSGPLLKSGYRAALTTGDPEAAVRVGVLSRLPVLYARSHMPARAGFHQRSILEVEVDCDGVSLFVFVCHFKAKSEGAEATEKSRILSAAAVRQRIEEILEADGGAEFLVLGDLNENADEYERVGRRYVTALFPLASADEAGTDPNLGDVLFVTGDRAELQGIGKRNGGAVPALYSPWLDDPPHPGSYLYRGRWESIDHALLGPGLLDEKGLTFADFDVPMGAYLFSSDGTLNRDYSDHLPVMVTLKKAD